MLSARRSTRTDLSIIIPTVTAIIAGLIGFLSSAYVTYLNNQGTLAVEQEKSKAESALEGQKFKTSLIIEAVKVGDKQKALDNLTFFIDAGFLDDPDGKIKGLLSRNVLPVLPDPQQLHTLEKQAIQSGDFSKAMTLAEQSIALARDQKDFNAISSELIQLGDLSVVTGRYTEALLHYREALALLGQSSNPDSKQISALEAKIAKLQDVR